ncbi:MAG: DNA polymerase sliding clamp [Candidatus Thermoplasmatota archaeon]|jgi:proliferating cell nuclear antigen|nr:DNA polymerase sliding clamp [Candidatus Thermoplasmatota archaeon]
MFEVEIKVESLRTVFSILTPIVGEVKLSADKDGWKIRAVDPAHVAMVDLGLLKSAFERYEVDPMELGLNVERLLEHLKSAKGDDTVLMKLDPDNRLVVSMSNLTLKMPLVDTSGFSDPKVPNLQLPVGLKLNSGELQKGLKVSASISDYITFDCSQEKLVMTSSEDLSSMTLDLLKGKDYEEVSFEKPAKSSFSLDYFSQLMKGVGTNRDIVLNLGNSYPLRLEFDFAEPNGHARYLLAPRIESS